MTRAALKGLLQRKLRALLTAMSVVLGVAMVSGTFMLTDSIQGAFDTIFESSYSETDAVVSGKPIVEGASSGNPTVSADVLARVRELPGVEAAAGSLAGPADHVEQHEADRLRRRAGHHRRLADLRRRRRSDLSALHAARADRGGLGTRPRPGRGRRRHCQGGGLQRRRHHRRVGVGPGRAVPDHRDRPLRRRRLARRRHDRCLRSARPPSGSCARTASTRSPSPPARAPPWRR